MEYDLDTLIWRLGCPNTQTVLWCEFNRAAEHLLLCGDSLRDTSFSLRAKNHTCKDTVFGVLTRTEAVPEGL